jgi:PKD repeat protein
MKTLFTTLMAMFITCFMALNAQAQTIEWQKCLGGSFYDDARSIQQTTDGGYIVAGYTKSNDGDVSGNHGSSDYWIVKLNATGDTTWTKCLGGSNDDYAHSIQQTTDGGYIVAGYTESNDGDVYGNHGSSDYWIVKLNATGDTTWTKNLGGSGYDYALSIQQTTDGGYIVAGYTESNDGDVSGNHDWYDFWVVKLNATGDTTWTKCFGGSSYDYARSIQQTTDGGYIVAGYTKSNDGDVSGFNDSTDYWIVKLNATGDTTWTKSLGGSNYDDAHSIQQTTDGGYIVAGYTYSNDGDVSGNHGGADFWVVKLSDSCSTDFYANNTDLCEGDTVTFTPTCTPDTADYYWDFGAGASPSTATGMGPHEVVYDWHGQFTVSLLVTSQGSTDTIIKTDYISVDSMLYVNAESNSPVCMGDTISLYTYSWESISWSWSGPNGFVSTQKNPKIPNASKANEGLYTVVATRANGCSNSNITYVSVDSFPNVIAESNSLVCKGDSIYLEETGGQAVSWNWSGPNGFVSTQKNPEISNASTADEGTYTVVATNTSGCSNSDTTYILVDSFPKSTTGSNSPICKGDSLYLFAYGSNSISWDWRGPNEFYSNSQYPVIHPASKLHSGIYTVKRTNANGCQNSDTVEVIIPSADFTYSVDTANHKYYFYDLSTGGSEITDWYWDFGDDSTSIARNPAHTFSQPGVFNVCLQINTSNCVDTICKDIYIPSDYEYDSIVETDKLWSTLSGKYMIISGGMHEYERSTSFMKFKEIPLTDSTGEIQVLKSYDSLKTWEKSGYIYENNKQVFFRDSGETQQQLMYNFDCQVGDTIRTGEYTEGYEKDVIDDLFTFSNSSIRGRVYIVEEIDTVEYFGIKRKQITIEDSSNGVTDIWIEGIGDIHYFFKPLSHSDWIPILGGGSFSKVLCVHENNNLIYKDTTRNTCYIADDTISISGRVYAGSNYLTSGTAQLYYSNNDSTQTPIETVSIDSGCYTFENLFVGNYKIMAIPETRYTEDYENTYYGDELYWSDAITVDANQDKAGIDIHLIEKMTGCTADFTFLADTNNYFRIEFYDRSVPEDDIISWFWDFGDRYYSSLQNPVHEYSDTGTYNVCLTMQTPYCKDTVCKEIHIALHKITGTVLAEFERVTNGTVQLFDARLNSDQAPLQTVLTDSGNFIFNNVHPGNYKVKAIPGTGFSDNFVPTYYVNKVTWDEAYTIPVRTDIANVVIHLAGKSGTGTKDIQSPANELHVYPNPAGAQLNLKISLEQAANMDIKILNITGQPVKTLNTSKSQGTHKIQLDVSELKQGMYFGKAVLNGQEQMVFRFIKK